MMRGARVRGIQRQPCQSLHFIPPGLLLMLVVACAGVADAAAQVVLDRNGGTIVLQAYAPNIIRVTLSLDKGGALAAPGYGFVAAPASTGWTHQQDEQADIYRSSRLIVKVAVNHPGKAMATQVDIAKFFNGSPPPATIAIQNPEGKTLLQMTGWSMSVPNRKDGNAGMLNE